MEALIIRITAEAVIITMTMITPEEMTIPAVITAEEIILPAVTTAEETILPAVMITAEETSLRKTQNKKTVKRPSDKDGLFFHIFSRSK